MKVASSYIIHGIGPKIRDLRKEKGYRLIELAEASGLSSPMVSKIENGRIVPTIPSLLSILQVLEIEPETFFAEINEEPEFEAYTHIQKEDYKAYVKEESAVGFLYRSIIEKSLDGGSSFQISHITLEPGNSRPQVSTDAYEFLYIISGTISFQLEDRTVTLEAGDSFFFDGKIPHVPLNQTEQPVQYLVIYFFNK